MIKTRKNAHFLTFFSISFFYRTSLGEKYARSQQMLHLGKCFKMRKGRREECAGGLQNAHYFSRTSIVFFFCKCALPFAKCALPFAKMRIILPRMRILKRSLFFFFLPPPPPNRTQHLITSESHRTEMATTLLSTLSTAAAHTMSTAAAHGDMMPTARRSGS